ncbi:hypothetical protein [Lysinibacillus telephonicus]|uniref:Uncharacterized protein n=1 Tax=Lysinibacillus telephonicus TaxID=1714840 RepID=A0A431ULT1_9BACI|nr:hypothetical protein [Lysinibacillus telephonicus]RTQ90796.1 hypothetical protein EKG35_14420 [Lysinibacillus telephonicus]
MTLIFLLGLIGVVLILFFKSSVVSFLGENNKFGMVLKNTSWFQNFWISGLFLFFMNGLLFFLTCLVLYILMAFLIPYVHLIVMAVAVITSLVLWSIINKSWQGKRKDRLKMAAIGSSFYLILTVIFLYKYVTIEPYFPGDDTFMRALGLFLAIMVTFVAFTACFVITGFSKGKAQIQFHA